MFLFVFGGGTMANTTMALSNVTASNNTAGGGMWLVPFAGVASSFVGGMVQRAVSMAGCK